MRRLPRLAALAGSACAILAGALTLASPASAATSTNTSFTLNVSSTDFDQSAAVKATFSVTSNEISPPINVDGGSVDIETILDQSLVSVCTGTVHSGTGSCNMVAGELPVGQYDFTAVYFPATGSGLAQSHSVSQPFQVNRGTSSTSFSLLHTALAFGQEAVFNEFNFKLQSSVGEPTGTVAAVETDSQGSINLCTATIDSGLGIGCALTDTQLTPGSYTVFGDYSGNETFRASNSLTQTLTILPGIAAATLTLSQPSIAVDQQENETLTASIVPARGGTPTGSVTFKDGATTLCDSAPLVNGTASCHLTPGQLAIGSHQIVIFYSGDSNFGSAASSSQTLTIGREHTTTALTLSAAKIRAGHEQTEHLTVRVKPATSGTPTGKVTIKAGTTILCVITLHLAKGTCTLTPSKLRPGTYHLVATYSGNTRFAKSTSTRKTLTVTK